MIRPAQPEDAKTYLAWLQAASDINLVDYSVYRYPNLKTIVVEDRENKLALINSFHSVLMMEALAPRPGISVITEARALAELFTAVREIAAKAGIQEIWFGCKDERLHGFIERRKFERFHFPMFRYRVGDSNVRH